MKKLFTSPLTVLTILTAFISACAHMPMAHAKLNAIDTFGSKRISAEEVQVNYGSQIREYAEKSEQQRFESAQEIAMKIAFEIKTKYNFAFVNLSLVSYFNAPYVGSYVTVDVVEQQDKSRRMAFSPLPQGTFSDPDGLIALWDQYQSKGMSLLKSGQLLPLKNCPAWHCIFSFDQPELIALLTEINSRVPLHEKELATILQSDSRAQYRGNAAFLLAHIKDGNSVVKYMLLVTKDPISMVRNNAVRVLALMGVYHPEIEIPVAPLLQVLNFPEATDRNKAAYALEPLSRKKENAQPIIDSAGHILLEMLKLQQPNNHDPAYLILKNISGQNFGDREYLSWENWLIQHGMN